MLAEYALQRDQLLSQITRALPGDLRFVAAWLGGSLGRGNADGVSDLDLTVVVSKEFADQLCARPEMITTWPPKARMALFEQFGDIGLVYENNHNTPGRGTTTSVIYAPAGIIVDWTLIAEDDAQRPIASQLLFTKIELSVKPKPGPVSLAERAKSASDNIGFFWLMASVTVKYIIRGDHVFVVRWLEELARLVQEIDQQVTGRPWEYNRGSVTNLKATREEQLELLRALCVQVHNLSPKVVALGGKVWPSANVGVERLWDMVE